MKKGKDSSGNNSARRGTKCKKGGKGKAKQTLQKEKEEKYTTPPFSLPPLSLIPFLPFPLSCIPSLFHLVGWTEKGARNQGTEREREREREREIREVSCARAINRN
jgi:hypothetical protein